MLLWSQGRKNRTRIDQKFNEKLMRILNAKIIDFLQKNGQNMRPWAAQKATKNEAKNGAENRVEKGHASSAEHAVKIGRGKGVPPIPFPCLPCDGH